MITFHRGGILDPLPFPLLNVMASAGCTGGFSGAHYALRKQQARADLLTYAHLGTHWSRLTQSDA